MLLQATVTETKRKMATHESTMAAIGSSFSKGPTVGFYENALQRVVDAVLGKKSTQGGDVEGLKRSLRGGKTRGTR